MDGPRKPIARALHALLATCRAAGRRWHLRQIERQFLESATDRELRDMGLTRADAQREAAKPFWRD
jgi:uncharacterized protein YjiS (DUF1127 family)